MGPPRNLLAGAGGGPGTRELMHEKGGLSLHGQNAARRQAITELLFFASVGDLLRCQKICATWKIDVSSQALRLCFAVGRLPVCLL